MEELIKVRENRLLLAVSVPCTVFFALCLIFSAFYGIRHEDMETLMICIPVFGGCMLLGLFLLLSFYRRKLVLYYDRFSYTPTLGRTKTFFYSEIQSVVPKGEKYIIYGYDGARLAVFEINMPYCDKALNFLLEKHVKIIHENSGLLSSLVRKISGWNLSLQITDKDAHIRSRYSPSSVLKRKRIARVIRIILTILSLLAIPLPNRQMIAIYILILFFNYFQYLFFYPQMTLEKEKDCTESRIPFPVLSCAVSMLCLISFIQIYHMEDRIQMSASIALSVILLIPCLLIRRIRRIKEHPFKILFTALVLFLLSFSLVLPINYVTAGQPAHNTVTVLSKETRRSSQTTHYEILVFWRGEMQKIGVSQNLYKALDEGDSVRICIRKSIWGTEVWNVHR